MKKDEFIPKNDYSSHRESIKSRSKSKKKS